MAGGPLEGRSQSFDVFPSPQLQLFSMSKLGWFGGTCADAGVWTHFPQAPNPMYPEGHDQSGC